MPGAACGRQCAGPATTAACVGIVPGIWGPASFSLRACERARGGGGGVCDTARSTCQPDVPIGVVAVPCCFSAVHTLAETATVPVPRGVPGCRKALMDKPRSLVTRKWLSSECSVYHALADSTVERRRCEIAPPRKSLEGVRECGVPDHHREHVAREPVQDDTWLWRRTCSSITPHRARARTWKEALKNLYNSHHECHEREGPGVLFSDEIARTCHFVIIHLCTQPDHH